MKFILALIIIIGLISFGKCVTPPLGWMGYILGFLAVQNLEIYAKWSNK